jgi:sensor domain CHASE-containing protein
MKLRTRVLFTSLICSILAIFIIYCISQAVVLRAFQRLEERGARADALRVVGLVREERARLLASCAQWARWDTTSDYLLGTSQTLTQRAINVPAFANLEVDNFVLVDTNGQVILAQGFDLQAMAFADPSTELLELVGQAELRARVGPNGIAGIVMLGDGPALLAAHPVVRPGEDAPSQGLLFLTRPLTPDRVAAMGRTLQFTPHLYRYDDPALRLDREALLADANFVQISMESSNRLTSYVMMPDVYGNPAIIWGISALRGIRQQGRATIHVFAIIISAVIAGSGGAMLVLLNRWVIRPLAQLSRELRDVGASGDLSLRVTATGRGELAELAQETNDALTRLEENGRALEQSEALWRSLVHTIPDLIFRATPWAPCPAEALASDPPLAVASIELVNRPPWVNSGDPAGTAIAALRALPPGAQGPWPQDIDIEHGPHGPRIYEA